MEITALSDRLVPDSVLIHIGVPLTVPCETGPIVAYRCVCVFSLTSQALIYALTVATKSQDERRKEAAESILQNMREHSSALVQQAIMVSEELIRVAILWHEQWHEGLEDASRWVGMVGGACNKEMIRF